MSLYRALYNVARRARWINFLLHLVIQGRLLNRNPMYRFFYNKLIQKRARKWLLRPPFLEITLTDICNASCVMCPPEVHSGKTIMSMSMFCKIVDEAQNIGIRKLVLTGGEPLIDPSLAEKIRYAKERGFLYVHMFTNGQLLNENRSRGLIAAGLNSLTVSIDSLEPDEYASIRIGLDFKTVMTNVRTFKKLRAEMGAQNPVFRISRVNLPNNVASTRKFLEEMKEVADIVELNDAHNWGEIQFNDITKGNIFKQDYRYPCNLLFQKVCLRPDGLIKKCSIDSRVMCDPETSLTDALNGSLAAIKQRMLRGDFSIEGCESCRHKQSWLNDWEMI